MHLPLMHTSFGGGASEAKVKTVQIVCLCSFCGTCG
uniref:Uncharacterized protein n=1 Tax=Anopheles minimus TaxID=112268 RepID=A0A182WQ02_9DIPT